jgi:hypothetical protein
LEKTIQVMITRAKTFIRGADIRSYSRSAAPVAMPEWVRDDPGFALGLKDGSIRELVFASPAVAPAPAPPLPAGLAPGEPVLGAGDKADAASAKSK